MSSAVLFLLCLLGLLSVASCQSSSVPVVTSMSGCTDVGATTVDCTLPVLITVRGSGFLSNISGATSLFYAQQPLYWISVQPQLSPAAVAAKFPSPAISPSARFPVNDTYFVFQLYYLGRGALVEGEPISVTVTVGGDYARSTMPWLAQTLAPFAGVTINSVAPPLISAISGCPVVGADGLSVAQCLPDANVLTLTGSGFLQWQGTTLFSNIGALQSYMRLNYDNTSVTRSAIVSDSLILVSLTSTFYRLLSAGDYGAPPQPFYVTEQYSSWQSTQMSVQFAPLPPPSFNTVAPYSYYELALLPACVWGFNRSSIVNCTAGSGLIRVQGSYLFQVTATVNGLPMTPLSYTYLTATPTLAYFVAPLYNFQPGVLYDVVLTGASGSVTLPKYMSFSGLATIVSAACRDPLLPSDVASLACLPGETVTLNGPYLPPPSTAFTITVYSVTSEQNVTCASPRYNSEFQLACDMLDPGTPSTTDWDTWSAPPSTQPLACI